MENRSLEIKIGFAVIVAAVAVLGFYIYTGGFNFQNGFKLYVDYTFSGSIQKGAPVRISGMKVGFVKDVKFMFGKKNRYNKNILVRLELFIYNKFHQTVRENSQFFITTAGILGENYIEIIPGDYSKPEIKKKGVYMGIAPPRIDLMISNVSNIIDKVAVILDENGDTISKTLTSVSKLVDTTNIILSENRENIKKSLDKVVNLLDNSVVLTNKINKIIGDGKIIKNSLLFTHNMLYKINKKIDPMLNSVETTLDNTNILLVETTDLLKKNRSNVEKLLKHGVNIAEKTELIVDKGTSMVIDIYDGKGNIGKILRGTDLYLYAKDLLYNLKRSPWKILWKGE